MWASKQYVFFIAVVKERADWELKPVELYGLTAVGMKELQ